MAIKAESGLNLPVSDFLVGAKSYLGEGLADRIPDDSSIERAVDVSALPVKSEVKALVGTAYAEFKQFIERHDCKDEEGYDNFNKLMQLVDGVGEMIWVINRDI